MTPNLFVIGVPRAATTSLAAALDQHPDIAVCPMKEPHYYVFPSVDEAFTGPGDDWILRTWIQDEADYRAQFDVTHQWQVDASTNYFHDPQAVGRILRDVPDARFIVVLRRPSDRARSAHRFLQWQGHETLEFGAAIDAEAERKASGWSRIWRYGEDSHYADSLLRFFNSVPERQRLVLTFEGLQDWGQASVAIHRFLDLELADLTFEQLNQKSAPPPKVLAWLLNRPSDLRTRIGDSKLGPVLAPALATGRRLAARATRHEPVPDDAIPESLNQSWNADIAAASVVLDRDLTHWQT